MSQEFSSSEVYQNTKKALETLVGTRKTKFSSEAVPDYQKTGDLMKAMLDISEPYMQQVAAVEAAYPKMAEGADKKKYDEQKASDINALKKIFTPQVQAEREKVLYHGQNRSLANGAGANDTPYSTADTARLKQDIATGKSVTAALENSEALVFARTGPKGPDGVGAPGGLVEMMYKHFDFFDIDKFNARDPEFLKKMSDFATSKDAALRDNKVPGFAIESTKHACEIAKRLVVVMDPKSTQAAVQKAQNELVHDYADDIMIGKDGKLAIIQDLDIVARHAARREKGEESRDIAGLPAAINDLYNSTKDAKGDLPDPRILLGGKGSKLVDDNYLLSKFGIDDRGKKESSQAVSPVVMGTEVSRDAMQDFKAKLSEITGPNAKFLNPINHMEISGCKVMSLNALRRRAGELDGVPLNQMVDRDPKYADYAYRYTHEHFGGPVKLSMEQVAKACGDDKALLKQVLSNMAKEDQRDVFKVDGKQHSIDYLSQAHVMFKETLKNHPKDKQTEVAYGLLAAELKIPAITPDILQAMDKAAKLEHEQQKSKLAFQAKRAMFEKAAPESTPSKSTPAPVVQLPAKLTSSPAVTAGNKPQLPPKPAAYQKQKAGLLSDQIASASGSKTTGTTKPLVAPRGPKYLEAIAAKLGKAETGAKPPIPAKGEGYRTAATAQQAKRGAKGGWGK